MKLLYACAVLSFLFFWNESCAQKNTQKDLVSPGGRITVRFILTDGVPQYLVDYAGTPIIEPSNLGFRFKAAAPLDKDFSLSQITYGSFDETWQPVWGTDKNVRNRYNDMIVKLKETSGAQRELDLIFRAFDDGIAFRYVFPRQPNLTKFEIVDEETLFRFAGDYSAWWIPQNFDSYEQLYSNTPVSGIKAVNTPVTLETGEGPVICLHEADLVDYAGMTLARPESEKHSLKAYLVPWPDDNVRVKASTPHRTPWRTIQIVENAGDLLESHMIQNLNPPNVLRDVSWIKPMKYMGIWWSLHLGKETWHMGPHHGATTQNAKRYIDFAASHGIGGLLVEGWNVGWENWGKGNNFNFLTPYPDYDLEEVVQYGREKGVALIIHNETGSNVKNYIDQMDAAFAFYEKLGVHAIKTGYVGPITPGGQHHHGQWMVNHYRDVVKKAAEHKIMVDAHEPIKPTGESRTYPNMMTREGVRGTEYEAWSEGNPPEHTTILPFTRMVGGPLDYTPGIFDLTFDKYRKKERVHTTLAKQLALYVVLFSPLQMAADLPENYDDNPAFAFIEDVPVSWDKTIALNAKIGDYVTVVRKSGDSWFLGSITDENGRNFDIPLSFLDRSGRYTATIYADAPDADWETNPRAIRIRKIQVNSNSSLNIKLAPGGGQAIEFSPGGN